MRRYLIVEGDPTSSGGMVVSGASSRMINNAGIARVGDLATCPLHGGVFPIVTGDHAYTVDDMEAARDGDYISCGCSLISVKQRLLYRDDEENGAGGMDPIQAAMAALAKTDPMAGMKTPVCEECLKKAAQAGTPLLGR